MTEKGNPNSIVRTLDLAESAPDLGDVKDKKHLMIIVLSAAGVSPTTVSREVGCSKQTVYNVLERYSLTEAIRDGVALQKVIIGTAIGGIMIDALSCLRDKVADFDKMKPRELIGIVQMCADVMNRIGPVEGTKRKASKAGLLSRLKEGSGKSQGDDSGKSHGDTQ